MPSRRRPARPLLLLVLPALVASLPFTAQARSDRDALRVVAAESETASNFDDEAGGDADADDPAIWVSRRDPAASIVLGALKNGGLAAYDLSGRTLQHVETPPAPADGLESGRFNNVDLVQGASWQGRTVDLAVVTDRGRDRLRIFEIDARGAAAGSAVLRDVTSPQAPRLFSTTEAEVEEQRTGYGLALVARAGGLPQAVVSRRHETRLGLVELVPDRDAVSYRMTSTLDLSDTFTLASGERWTPCQDPGERPQIEGMVVDGETSTLWAAQEDVGIWRVRLTDEGFGKAKLIERVATYGADLVFDEETEECLPGGDFEPSPRSHLVADAEGLTIARMAGGRDLLLASSQGDSTFAVFELRHGTPRFVRQFAVGDSRSTDSVQHSDGAAVETRPLGPLFPHGLLVVHDGENTPGSVDGEGDLRADTNFKLVDWRSVARTLR